MAGFDGQLVHVEVDISRGLPMFDIIGLPDASVRESRDRVRAALRNAKFAFPTGRIVVNLAPADIPKSGPACDLAIALGILAASGQLPKDRLHRYCIIGELSLDGRIQSVPGLLPIVLAAARQDLAVFTSNDAEKEVGLVPGLAVATAETLSEAVAKLRPGPSVEIATVRPSDRDGGQRSSLQETVEPMRAENLSDVKGQAFAKRALEIAAAGEHNLLMIGPPGVGKTMLARRLPGILPPLSRDEHLDMCRIYSIAGLLDKERVSRRDRPFRAPHHAATKAGLLGGARGVPGEVSLAHHGVLFLDELNEFPRGLLESLRQPLEDGTVVLARLPRPIRFPARFALVAAANPCPCGFYGDNRRECRCAQSSIDAYRNKLSGPLADRIDLYVEMGTPTWNELADSVTGETSDVIRERVVAARARQRHRFRSTTPGANGRMDQAQLRQYCLLDNSAESLLRFAAESLSLSARAVHRTLKVARTIADLDGSDGVTTVHIQEALAFRAGFIDSSGGSRPHTHLRKKGGTVG